MASIHKQTDYICTQCGKDMMEVKEGNNGFLSCLNMCGKLIPIPWAQKALSDKKIKRKTPTHDDT